MLFEITCTFLDPKTGITKELILIAKNKSGKNEIPYSLFAQINNIMASASEGAEHVSCKFLFLCSPDKTDEILKHKEEDDKEVHTIRNVYNLSKEAMCVYFLNRNMGYNARIIADLLGFNTTRTVKTILDQRVDNMKLENIQQFQEEWDDKYGDLTLEIILGWASFIKIEPKDKKQSYK